MIISNPMNPHRISEALLSPDVVDGIVFWTENPAPIQKLSSLIGKKRVVWRYDPILLNDKYTMQYHMKHFRVLCDRLTGYTEKCTISFLDLYKNIQCSIAPLGIHPLTLQKAEELAGDFSEVAKTGSALSVSEIISLISKEIRTSVPRADVFPV